jgi:hypothetical protein
MAVCLSLLYSCKDEPIESLTGTYWVAEGELFSGQIEPIEEGHKYELTFTSENEVTCRIYMSPTENWSLSGTYSYLYTFEKVK